MIVGIKGVLGSGKTLMLTRYVVKAYKQGKKIISNYHLKGIPYTKLDIVDLYLNHPELKDIFIAGDELYTFMDCRLSMKRRNVIESYFILQTRKKNVDLFFTAQSFSTVDVRLLRFIDIQIKMKKIWLVDDKGNKTAHPYLFLAEFIDYRDIDNIQTKSMILDGRKWFNYYDTNEVIYPPDDYLYTEKEIKEKEKERKKIEKEKEKFKL